MSAIEKSILAPNVSFGSSARITARKHWWPVYLNQQTLSVAINSRLRWLRAPATKDKAWRKRVIPAAGRNLPVYGCNNRHHAL
jgi:hypothetical protein